MSSLLAVSDVARELGVHESRVRALIAAGELDAEKVGGRWLVDRAVVARRKRQPPGPGRPLSARNAWALLLGASGEPLPAGLDPVASWRVRQSLAQHGLRGLGNRLQRRAHAQEYRALRGELRALRSAEQIVVSGSSAAGAHHLELLAPDALDAYLPASKLADVVAEHALQPAPSAEANVILRAVPDDAWLLAGREAAPLSAVALDLAAYPDPRSRRVGQQLLDELDQQAPAHR
jgi:excisionase family DNA binding protein